MERPLIIKRITLFLLVSFTVPAAVVIIFPNQMNRGQASVVPGLMMFLPAIGMLFVRYITKEGFGGMLIKPSPGKGWRYFMLGWLGTIVLSVATFLVYITICPNDFAPPTQLKTTAMQLLFSPLLSLPLALGEEWGWRGYLQPKLSGVMGETSSILVTGIIWGLWHTPFVIVEQSCKIPDILFGVIQYLILCVSLGTVYSYLTVQSGSVLPAAVGHITFNLSTGIIGEMSQQSYPHSDMIFTGVQFVLIVIAAGFCLHRLSYRGNPRV